MSKIHVHIQLQSSHRECRYLIGYAALLIVRDSFEECKQQCMVLNRKAAMTMILSKF